MTHYIIDGGPFAGAAANLLALRLVNPIPRPVRTFPGGTWTWTSAGEARERRSQGQGSSHAGQVCLRSMQGCGMGQARAESGMWRLPGSHGLSPESHLQSMSGQSG